MRSAVLAAALSVGLGLTVCAVGAEEITEHETYEKRTLKIETGPAATATTTTLAPKRLYEHHAESESTTIERRSAAPPAAIVKERTTDSVDTEKKN